MEDIAEQLNRIHQNLYKRQNKNIKQIKNKGTKQKCNINI